MCQWRIKGRWWRTQTIVQTDRAMTYMISSSWEINSIKIKGISSMRRRTRVVHSTHCQEEVQGYLNPKEVHCLRRGEATTMCLLSRRATSRATLRTSMSERRAPLSMTSMTITLKMYYRSRWSLVTLMILSLCPHPSICIYLLIRRCCVLFSQSSTRTSTPIWKYLRKHPNTTNS